MVWPPKRVRGHAQVIVTHREDAVGAAGAGVDARGRLLPLPRGLALQAQRLLHVAHRHHRQPRDHHLTLRVLPHLERAPPALLLRRLKQRVPQHLLRPRRTPPCRQRRQPGRRRRSRRCRAALLLRCAREAVADAAAAAVGRKQVVDQLVVQLKARDGHAQVARRDLRRLQHRLQHPGQQARVVSAALRAHTHTHTRHTHTCTNLAGLSGPLRWPRRQRRVRDGPVGRAAPRWSASCPSHSSQTQTPRCSWNAGAAGHPPAHEQPAAAAQRWLQGAAPQTLSLLAGAG